MGNKNLCDSVDCDSLEPNMQYLRYVCTIKASRPTKLNHLPVAISLELAMKNNWNSEETILRTCISGTIRASVKSGVI